MNKKRTVAALLLAALLPLGAPADEHEADERPKVVSAWMVTPKSGMEQEFESAIREHLAFRRAQEDSRKWWVLTPVAGENLSVYQVRSESFAWPDQDAYETESVEKGFGEHWGETTHPYVDRYQHYFEIIDWENSHWPEAMQPGPMFGVWTTEIDPEADTDYYDARERMNELAKDGWASDENRWLWLSRLGGANKLMLVESYASYADIEEDQSFYDWCVEKIGEEAANEMFDDYGSGIERMDYTLWRYRADLSEASAD